MLQHILKKNKIDFEESNPLLLMQFQQHIEKLAFKEGGGKFVAPAQRMVDFCNNQTSSSLPACSYLPGIAPADCRSVLPPFIYTALQKSIYIIRGKNERLFYQRCHNSCH